MRTTIPAVALAVMAFSSATVASAKPPVEGQQAAQTNAAHQSASVARPPHVPPWDVCYDWFDGYCHSFVRK